MEMIESGDGTQIAVERSGRGAPLVLVHGATVDHTAWDAVVPLLRDRYTVFAMDRRGRGQSGDADEYDPDREVTDIAAVLDVVRDEMGHPADLVGHSSGAVLALEATHRAPEAVRRLVLYEPPLYVDPYSAPSGLPGRLRAALSDGDREGALTLFLREGPEWPDAQLDRLRATPQWGAMLALAYTTPYDADIVYDYTLDDIRAARIATPTLVLLGEHSPARQRAACEAVAEAVPGARLATLPGQEHTAMYTAPQLLARTLADFLAG